MSEELLGCPICNNEPFHAPTQDDYSYRVFCDQGFDEHIIVIYGVDKEDAFKKWNTRTPQLSEKALRDIYNIATRNKRACSNKKYLIFDLENIEKLVGILLNLKSRR